MATPAIESANPHIDIRAMALGNDAFRRVLRTGKHQQVVVMTIQPGGEIGAEVHVAIDQLFFVIEGVAEAQVADQTWEAVSGEVVFVEAGTRHNIVNRATAPLRLITVYAPPAHAAGTVHLTRAEADRAEHGEAGG